eukprot:4311092-Pyramimonas_sp.AAC.1
MMYAGRPEQTSLAGCAQARVPIDADSRGSSVRLVTCSLATVMLSGLRTRRGRGLALGGAPVLKQRL